MFELSPTRMAELYLTVGRICKWTGAILAFPPLLIAIPGLVLLMAGLELWRQGENAWNEAHRLPQRVPEGKFF